MKIDLIDRPRLEVLNKRGNKYNLQDAEKDYFLAVILSILYDSDFKNDLVFKGGTAIYHCYFDQVRFSKDLDFTSKVKIEPVDLENIFSKYDIFKLKYIEQKKYGLDVSLQYKGALAQADSIGIDINTNQMVLLKPKTIVYKNCYGINVSCLVMDEKEIFAEKIRTLNDRARPRDLYDLVLLKNKYELTIEDALSLLSRKKMHIRLDKERISENARISLDRYDDEMKELYYDKLIKKAEIQSVIDELLALISIHNT